ncbi:hypothetical protein FJT64_019068 [Amphibalanus amphitrite]|uniref:Peptidase A2 domain-containing protein n=1 Tax=Amphibalanus amphitrite TaxID=1232801 RepID=A0A6A4WX08_AMPAM|nr:hypothetical protein FJT64_019068 [Amphibalanus amphitrite]
MSDIDKLTQLLLQQAELSAQREERLAGVFTMAARADSGAEATVIGEDSLSSICVKPAQLEPCIGQPFSAVGRHPLTCIGSFQAALELGDRSTTAAVFVIKEMTGLLLSWFDCVALGILPRDFPAQIRSVEDAPRPTDDATHSGDVTPSDDVTPSALPAAAGSARCASDRPTPCETPRDRLCPATGAETGGPAPPADGPSPAAGLGGPLPAWNSDSDPPEATVPVKVKANGRSLIVNALLDPCSDASFLTDAASKELGLQGVPEQFELGTVEGSSQVNMKKSEVERCSIIGPFKTSIGVYVINDLSSASAKIDWNMTKSKWNHLKNISFPNVSRRQGIDMLIGLTASTTSLFLSLETRQGEAHEPVGVKTPLGWTAFRPVEDAKKKNFSKTLRTHVSVNNQDEIDAIHAMT